MENAFLQRYFLGNIFFSEKISKICTWKANVIIVNISQQILTEKRSVFISYHSPVQGQLSSRINTNPNTNPKCNPNWEQFSSVAIVRTLCSPCTLSKEMLEAGAFMSTENLNRYT